MGIPKNARKLTIGDELWYWRTNGWRVEVWEPNEVYHDFSAETAFGQYNAAYMYDYEYKSGLPIEPGMIRLYIEENFMKQTPEFVPEMPEVGKLFIYRHQKVSQGSSISVKSIKGGDYEPYKRFSAFLTMLERKAPLFLVRYSTSIKDKTSYAKFLVGDIIFEVNIPYPRTFRASFERYDIWRERQKT